MTTIFTHPAVEKYLADLDLALAHAKTDHADDLRDQVREHLEEALAPDASDADIEAAIARLGPPDCLLPVADPAGETIVYTRPSITGWLRRRPNKWWAAVGVMAVLLSAIATAWTVEARVAPVSSGCYPCNFLFDADRSLQIEPPDYDSEQFVVTQRFAHDQAFSFTLVNASRFIQVVHGGRIGSSADTFTPEWLDISTAAPGHTEATSGWPQTFSSGRVAIPPGEQRQVVLHIVQNGCMLPRDSVTQETVPLRVSALGITRTETVKLPSPLTIVGSTARGHCRMGQTARSTIQRSR